ncbi:MAG: hypothetical protein ACLUOI_12830 [Eisenbergiella sp.]
MKKTKKTREKDDIGRCLCPGCKKGGEELAEKRRRCVWGNLQNQIAQKGYIYEV